MSVRQHTFGPRVAALRKAIGEINDLLLKANEAERYQVRAANLAKQLSIGWDRYGNREVHEDMVSTAKAINAKIEAEVQIESRARRDAEIEHLSEAIDSARIALPDLAAKACIELGVLAREMKEENESET